MFQIDDPNGINAGATPPAQTTPVGTPAWFGEGNAGTGTPATPVRGDWLNMLQAEGMALAQAAGLAPGKTATPDQWAATLRRLAGAHQRTVAASTTLTPDDSGLVLVNAAGGNVTVTLPAAASAGGAPLPFVFRRIDAGAATVTIAFAGADVLAYSGASSLTLGASSGLHVLSDGVSSWWPLSYQQRASGTTGYVRRVDGMLEQWGRVAFSGVPSIPNAYPGGTGFNANATATIAFPTAFPLACYEVQCIGCDDGTAQEGSEWSVALIGAPSATQFGVRASRVNGDNATGSETGLILWRAIGE